MKEEIVKEYRFLCFRLVKYKLPSGVCVDPIKNEWREVPKFKWKLERWRWPNGPNSKMHWG